MKKITILALHLSYGGVENCISTLVNKLCSEYEVSIISIYKLYDKPVYDIDERVKITYLMEDDLALRVDEYKVLLKGYALKTLFKRLFKDYIKGLHFFKLVRDTVMSAVMVINKKRLMAKYLKSDNSDVIISTKVSINKQVGKYIGSRTKKIAWEHNHHHGDVKYIDQLIESCHNMDSLVLVSDSLRSFYKKEMKKKNYKCKCSYIPNSLEFVPKEVSKLNNKNIISVGRLAKEKGYDDLIDVFKKIHDMDKDTHLDIIGDGAQRNFIADKIYTYGLNGSVTLHGFKKKDYINKLLQESSLYLMSSHTESFGLVLIEAMSYGIPCLAFTSAEGANDVITDNVDGYLIKNRDIEEMAKSSIDLLNNNKKLKEMGKNARNSSLKYSTDIVLKEWNNLIRKG